MQQIEMFLLPHFSALGTAVVTVENFIAPTVAPQYKTVQFDFIVNAVIVPALINSGNTSSNGMFVSTVFKTG